MDDGTQTYIFSYDIPHEVVIKIFKHREKVQKIECLTHYHLRRDYVSA